MDIRITECKDTYVTSCTPPPPVDLPECEDGWEIGNGTAVCTTQSEDSLALTGGETPDYLMGGAVITVLLGIALIGTALTRKRREQ